MWLLVVLSATALASPSFGQLQRVGFFGQVAEIAAHAVSGAIEGFCLDRHLDPPSEPTSYASLLDGSARATVRVGDGPEIPLAEALNRVVRLEVEENEDLGSDAILQGHFVNLVDKPIVVRLEGSVAFGEHEGVISETEMAAVRPGRSNQEMWTDIEGERLWKTLGYHEGQEHDRRPAAQARVAQFQKDHGLEADGKLGPNTRRALESQAESVSARLEAIGFPNHDVANGIAAYETYLGLPRTGRLSRELSARLEEDERTLQALEDRPEAAGPTSIEGGATIVPLDDDRFGVVKAGDLESWQVGWGVERTRGSEAVAAIEQAASRRLTKVGMGRLIGVHSPLAATGPGRLVVDGIPAESSYTEFVGGRAGLPSVETAILEARERGERPRILVQPSALAAVGIVTSSDGYRYDPTNAKAGAELLPLAIALQRSYGRHADVGLMIDVDRGLDNLSTLPSVEEGSQVRVYVDEEHLRDYGIIANVRADLRDAHIEVVRVGAGAPGTPRVVLFAGHNTADFRAMVKGMAGRQLFKDSIVALAVCGQGGEVEFNTELIRESGAKGVLFYDQRINAQAVEDVLLRFAGLVAEVGSRGLELQGLWRRSVELALDEAIAEERAEIEKLFSAVLQLSLLAQDSTEGQA